ncbi:MAG: N5-glutamine methyltransferase family protein, partial [Chloroflexota bacterium]
MVRAPERPATRSIKEQVQAAAERLAMGQTDTPRLDAEVLMGFVLGWDRARLLAHWDEAAADAARDRFAGLVERRHRGEPVAYLRRRKEFFGLDFYVDERVLIPRPETEMLVSHALLWLDRWGPGSATPRRMVDVGTGSGAIAVAVAVARPDVCVTGVDASAPALEVARMNAERHGATVSLAHGSLLEPVRGAFDLLVANLPYLSAAEHLALLPTSIGYEPR